MNGSYEERTSTDEIAFIEITLVKVAFSGSGYRTIRSDDGATNYTAPHWNDPDGDGDPSDGHAYPVTYVSNTKLTVAPEWKLEPEVDGVDFKIKATGPESISIDEVNAEVSGDKVDLASAAEASDEFEKDKVCYWEEFELAFEASFQGEDEWVEVGTSKNQLYVTRPAPAVSPLYHTVVDVACRNADGLLTESDIVTAIWSDFAAPSSGVSTVLPVRPPGMVGPLQPFTYYSNSSRPYDTPTTFEDLLATGDGRCGPFAIFFTQTLAAHSISANVLGVDAPTLGEAAARVDYEATFGHPVPSLCSSA